MVPDLYMQSHFGGTLDYMFNDKFGITGGAKRTLSVRLLKSAMKIRSL